MEILLNSSMPTETMFYQGLRLFQCLRPCQKKDRQLKTKENADEILDLVRVQIVD